MDSEEGKTFKKVFAFIFSLGVITILIGLIYGCVTVGVPQRDIRPELAARQVSNSLLSQRIMVIGIAFSFVSVVMMVTGYSIYKFVKKFYKFIFGVFSKTC